MVLRAVSFSSCAQESQKCPSTSFPRTSQKGFLHAQKSDYQEAELELGKSLQRIIVRMHSLHYFLYFSYWPLPPSWFLILGWENSLAASNTEAYMFLLKSHLTFFAVIKPKYKPWENTIIDLLGMWVYRIPALNQSFIKRRGKNKTFVIVKLGDSGRKRNRKQERACGRFKKKLGGDSSKGWNTCFAEGIGCMGAKSILDITLIFSWTLCQEKPWSTAKYDTPNPKSKCEYR